MPMRNWHHQLIISQAILTLSLWYRKWFITDDVSIDMTVNSNCWVTPPITSSQTMSSPMTLQCSSDITDDIITDHSTQWRNHVCIELVILRWWRNRSGHELTPRGWGMTSVVPTEQTDIHRLQMVLGHQSTILGLGPAGETDKVN